MPKLIKNLFFFLLVLVAIMTYVEPDWYKFSDYELETEFVLAAEDTLTEVADVAGIQTEVTDPRIIVGNIIRVMLGFLGLISIVVIIYGGFLYMTSGGNEMAVEKAKKVIKYGIIGLTIIILSFAITSYVISQLSKALGEGETISTGGSGSGTGSGSGQESSYAAFRINGISPKGDNRPVNSQVNIYFNRALGDNATSSVKVFRLTEKKSSENTIIVEEEVKGEFLLYEKSIVFLPTGECPLGCNFDNCFSANSKFLIKVSPNLEDKNKNKINCQVSGSGACTAEFSTSAICDSVKPQVWFSIAPWNVMEKTDPYIEIKASDNVGLAAYNLCYEGVDPKDCLDSPIAGNPTTFSYSTNLYASNLATGTYKVIATVTDVVGLKNYATHEFFIANRECYDEAGNFNCSNSGCWLAGTKNCACDKTTDFCVCDKVNGQIKCEVWTKPIITAVKPDHGPVGTYVTISGRNFGNQPNIVQIGGQTVELVCGAQNSWRDDQIIVRIGDKIKTGSIKVITKNNGEYDSKISDGPSWRWQGDFTVESGQAKSIGLCSILDKQTNQPEGGVGSLVKASGVNFGQQLEDSKVLFNGVESTYVSSWNDTTIEDIKVPNITALGKINVQVHSYSIYSNPVEFTLVAPKSIIRIDSVLPSPAARTQYVTISGEGFGSGGSVTFIKDGKRTVAALGCSDGWKNDEIVVQVPANLEYGVYAVEVKNDKNVVAKKDAILEIKDIAAVPGLCSVTPNNGPAGTYLKLYGNAFGTTPGEVYFTISKDDSGNLIYDKEKFPSSGIWSNKEISNFQVPGFAKSGEIYVKTAAGESNHLKFIVANCTANPSSCGEGKVCCNNSCVASGTCSKPQPTSCVYNKWQFTTGNLPNVPKIIERPCVQGTRNESPSPKNGTTNVCLNANIGFTFNNLMEMNSLKNLIVLKTWQPVNGVCNVNDCIPSKNCWERLYYPDNIEPGDFYEVNYPDDKNKVTQVLLHRVGGLFFPNLCYNVTIKKGAYIKGQPENIMPNDYSWTFKTVDRYCTITSVVMSPQAGVIESLNEEQKFGLNGQAEDCRIIDVSDYKWHWSLNKYWDRLIRTVAPTDADYNKSFASYKINTNAPVLETTVGDPATVTAVEEFGKWSAKGTLAVSFSQPRVIDYAPACESACVNAQMSATFNVNMNFNNLPAGKKLSDYIELYKCPNLQCVVGITKIPLADNSFSTYDCLTYNNKQYCKNLIFGQNVKLEKATFYRVVIKGDLTSLSGKKLTGLNYPTETPISYSWIFKTKDDSSFCEPAQVKVVPVEYYGKEAGEKVTLFAETYGSPDNCSASGQKLNSYLNKWLWTTDDPDEKYLTLKTYKYAEQEQSGCSDKCLNIGSTPYTAVCGNKIEEVGEECDDGNANDGDICSSKCLNSRIGFKCGDGIINRDLTEECDDGNRINGDGCNENCYNEGSTKAKVNCGNGILEFGEDGDFGSAEANAKQGLNSECLHTGASIKITDNKIICGNGIVEAGEECDYLADCKYLDGSTCSFGDSKFVNKNGLIQIEYCLCSHSSLTCTNTCLNSGSKKCVTPTEKNCCGNGVVELTAGEECDSSPGCSASCLNLGSSLNYNPSSVCRDGVAGFGEDKNCEAVAVPVWGSGPLAEALLKGAGLSWKVLVTANIINTYKKGQASIFFNVTGKEVENCITACQLNPNDPNYNCAECLKCADKPKAEVLNSSICQNGIIQISIKPEIKALNGLSITDFPFKSNIELFYKNTLIPPASYSFTVSIVPKVETKFSINLIKNDGSAQLWPAGDYRVKFKNLINSCNLDAKVNDVTFKVINEFCHFDYVKFSPAYRMFNALSESQMITYEAMNERATGNDIPIVPIPGEYDWSWKVAPEKLNNDIVTVSSDNIVQPKNQNGQTNVNATATIINDKYFGEGTRSLTGSGVFEVFLCENPWKVSGNEVGWSDPVYNIRLLYCRDQGKGNDTSDDLPKLKSITAGKGKGNCNDGIDNDGDGGVDYMNKVERNRLVKEKENINTIVDLFDVIRQQLNLNLKHQVEVTDIGRGLLSKNYKLYYNNIMIKSWPIQDDKIDITATNLDIDNDRIIDVIFEGKIIVTDKFFNYDLSIDVIKSFKDPDCSSPNDYETSNILKKNLLGEYFFLRDNSPLVDGIKDLSPDAIAMRIYANPENISAREWYNRYVPNKSGGVSDIKVACDKQNEKEWCYYGVRDGNTVYISGGNVNSNVLYNNIYVIGYSENSNSATTNIFNQMITNLRLNLNYQDDSTIYQKIKRDVKRLNDINYLRQLLMNYKIKKGSYPNLESGTYARHISLSIWPSWKTVLGNLLGALIPYDPLNELKASKDDLIPNINNNGAVCEGTNLKCSKKDNQCYGIKNPFDPTKTDYYCSICAPGSALDTCYNSTTQTFGISDPAEFYNSDSYIYGYEYLFNNNSGKLYFKFETPFEINNKPENNLP